jgi:hypothetical protein
MLGAAEVGGAPQPNEDGGANEGVGKDGWNGVDVGNEEKSADIGAAYDVPPRPFTTNKQKELGYRQRVK